MNAVYNKIMKITKYDSDIQALISITQNISMKRLYFQELLIKIWNKN